MIDYQQYFAKENQLRHLARRAGLPDSRRVASSMNLRLLYEPLILPVPVVAALPGVRHPISGGPEFVPLRVLADSASQWNKKPIIVGRHPQQGGVYVSPDASSSVGIIANSHIENDALVCLALFDAQKLKTVSPSLYTKLRNFEQCGVSIGAFVRVDPTPGEDNGKPYGSTWLSARPDHLVILEDPRSAACSIAEGAGTWMQPLDPAVLSRETRLLSRQKSGQAKRGRKEPGISDARLTTSERVAQITALVSPRPSLDPPKTFPRIHENGGICCSNPRGMCPKCLAYFGETESINSAMFNSELGTWRTQ